MCTEFEVQDEKKLVDKQKVDMFLASKKSFFPSHRLLFLKEKLYELDDKKFSMLAFVELKDPNTVLILSLFLGSYGVDRFMINNIGLGILKLLTCGCCGILTFIDWFLIRQETRELNFSNIIDCIK